MAGPSLEVFKFGLYLFFPLAIMVHYGDPEWYHQHVLPIRDSFWPKEETLYHPPRTSTDVKSALQDLRQKRIARREGRTGQAGSRPGVDEGHGEASRPTEHSCGCGSGKGHASLGAARRDVQGSIPDWAANASRRLV